MGCNGYYTQAQRFFCSIYSLIADVAALSVVHFYSRDAPMSQLEAQAEQFKAELLNGNDQAINKPSDTYGKTWKRLNTDLDTITKKLWAAREAGEEMSPSWLFRQERYKAPMGQVEAELRQGNFATSSTTSTVNEKLRAIELASGQALD